MDKLKEKKIISPKQHIEINESIGQIKKSSMKN